jgi:uncharacterized membrane protein YhaH (DUF805 family)
VRSAFWWFFGALVIIALVAFGAAGVLGYYLEGSDLP